MYSCFVFERDGGYEYNKLGSLTWTNGLSVAVPMLEAGLRLGDSKKRDQALRFIENALANCMNTRSGLPYDAVENGKWSVMGWWFDGMYTKGHSAYLMGQAMYYILKAYLAEKKHAGIEHRDWLDFVSPVIERLEKTRNADSEYPYIISEETGAGLEYDSMGRSMVHDGGFDVYEYHWGQEISKADKRERASLLRKICKVHGMLWRTT